MRRRLDHLATFESLTSIEQPEYAAWADTRLDRWLVDWSLRNSKEATAKSIAKSREIEVGLSPFLRDTSLNELERIWPKLN